MKIPFTDGVELITESHTTRFSARVHKDSCVVGVVEIAIHDDGQSFRYYLPDSDEEVRDAADLTEAVNKLLAWYETAKPMFKDLEPGDNFRAVDFDQTLIKIEPIEDSQGTTVTAVSLETGVSYRIGDGREVVKR